MKISIDSYKPGVKVIGQVGFDITIGPDNIIRAGISWHGPTAEEEAELTPEQLTHVIAIIEELRTHGVQNMERWKK